MGFSMIVLNPNFLEKNGIREYAILPYEEFIRLQDELADYEDLRLLREAKVIEAESPSVSFNDVKKEFGIN